MLHLVSIRWRARLPVWVAILWIGLIGIDGAWAARWYEDYEQAADAIDSGVCSPEAIQLLGAAITDKPKPRLNARTIAQKRVDYLPYFQLARAHLNCRHFDLSRKYLADSRSHGVAPDDALDLLQARLERLEQQAARPAEPVVDPAQVADRVDRAQEQLTRAAAAASDLAALVGDPVVAGLQTSNPEWQSRRREAEQRLESARDRLREGVDASDEIVLADAAVLAADAAAEFSGLENEMRAARARSLERRAEPPPTAIVERRLRPTVTPPPTMAAPRPIETPAPVEEVSVRLRRAAALFVEGDYQGTVDVLVDPLPVDGGERAASLMLRSAARWSLSRLAPDDGRELREASAADAVACRRIDSAMEPDGRWFSPAFREFFAASVEPEGA